MKYRTVLSCNGVYFEVSYRIVVYRHISVCILKPLPTAAGQNCFAATPTPLYPPSADPFPTPCTTPYPCTPPWAESRLTRYY